MNLLEFANPLAWWWLLLALPIIAIYILKVRSRRKAISTLLFWDQLFLEKKPRAWWQHLRHILSLLLQLAFLLLLVFALVDPLWSWQKAQRRKLHVVIDNSASMAAMEGGQSRLDKAKQAAAALVRSMRVGDEMAILSAGGKSEVAVGLTDHARTLLDAINSIPQTDAPSALKNAVVAARRLIVGDAQPNIYVLTDGCDAATGELSSDKSLTLMGFGSQQDNVAITQFQVRRSLLDAVGYQTLIEITNFSAQAYKGRVELTLEDQLVDVLPVELEAGASKTMHVDQASATGGRLVARIDHSDALAVDNTARAVLPARRPMAVTLVSPGSLFLESALRAIPLVDLKVEKALTASDSAAESVAPATRGIMMLHGAVPETLPPGRVFVIGPTTNCNLWTVGEPIEAPIVAAVNESSTITSHVKLTNVLFPEAKQLTFVEASNTEGSGGPVELLIKTPLDEPLLAHIRRPGIGDVLVLNVNLDEGDLPLRIAFPVLMKNVLEWFEGTDASLQAALATGNTATIRLPKMSQVASNAEPASDKGSSEGVAADARSEAMIERVEVSRTSTQTRPRELWVMDPQGQRTPLAHDADTATLNVMKFSGLWAVGTQEDLDRDTWMTSTKAGANPTNARTNKNVGTKGNQNAAATEASSTGNVDNVVHLACNLTSRDESDLRPRVELARPAEFGLMSLGGRSIWFYCTLFALALAAIEWWLYQRRIVG